jgi:predicted phosphodiesterase
LRARTWVVADIHGNDVALRAVLKDAGGVGVDHWWALGDLVLFGPRPAEVLELLQDLPGLSMLRGNTDRYVLTGEQPAPHATVAEPGARTSCSATRPWQRESAGPAAYWIRPACSAS